MITKVFIKSYLKPVTTIKKSRLMLYLYSTSKLAGIKFVLLVLCIFVLNTKSIAQQKNYSHFKISITNASDEILLVKYKGIWELPGKKYIDSRSIMEFTGFMAEELGVTFKDLRLRGLFTFYNNDATIPIIFNYYSACYKSGQLKVPPGCTDIGWFSLNEALEVIPIKTMKMILKKMFEKKSYVWGASMHISKFDDRRLDIVTLKEDFYPLSE